MSMHRSRTHARLILAATLACLTLAGCEYAQNLAFLKASVNTEAQGHRSDERGPAFDTAAIGRRAPDSATDWLTYNNTLSAVRYSPLTQITTTNVGSLRPACTFGLGTAVDFQTGPVVVDGTMYVTSALATWAIDARTCRLRWKHAYDYYPEPGWDLKVNRGVAYLDTPDGPRLFRGSNDGRVYALDARTGRELWNVKEGDVSLGETFPAAPVAWHGLVYIGNAGGDNFAVTGRMMALDARTGANVWTVDLVPRVGPANLTWPAETARVPHAGGTTWTSYAADTVAGVIWLATGNAAPDFLESARPGSNQHTYSILALDLRTGEIRKAFQLRDRDYHDWDMAATPLLVKSSLGHAMVVEAGKDGYLYAVDPETGQVTYKSSTTSHVNDTMPLTAAGTRFCPGVQGGTEYNGPAYSPQTNMLYVPAVDWCSTVKLGTREELDDKAGLPWTGAKGLLHPFGVMDPQKSWSGWLTAYDAETGATKWQYHSPTPMVAGVTATAGGLVFTADLRGNVLGFDARDGTIRFRASTGQPIGGGVVSYAAGGKQYLAVASGMSAPMTWLTKSDAAKVVVYSLP